MCVQEERFGYRFFSQFQLVVNALDNEEARKHVNLMCFNLNLPLVDSGTNGYAAQVKLFSSCLVHSHHEGSNAVLSVRRAAQGPEFPRVHDKAEA